MLPSPSAAAYDAVAASYDTSFTRPVDLAENALVFDRIRALHATHPGLVLDVGCGTGLLLDTLALAPAEYLGLDISSAMLNVATRKHPRHRFLLGDMADLSLVPDTSCALVVNLFGSFSYAEDPLPVLAEMQRVLTPGGAFFLMACTPRYARRQSYILHREQQEAPLRLWRRVHLCQTLQQAAPALQVMCAGGLHLLPDRACAWLPSRLVLPMLRLEQHTLGHLFPNAGYFLVVEGVKRCHNAP